MKFIKRLALDRKNQTSNRFAIEANDRIVTTSKVSFQLPSGETSDRPASPQNGEVRYNQTTHDAELYNIDGEGTGWEKIKTNRQSVITPQDLGYGDYTNSLFGPLSFDVATDSPQNIMVFIDSVYQVPNTHYTLVPGSSVSESATVDLPANTGTTLININTTTNILEGQNVTGPIGVFATGTVVTNVNVTATQITIDTPLLDNLDVSDTLLFTFNEGTFIQFNGEVPAKPVFVLLGLDGYNPNN